MSEQPPYPQPSGYPVGWGQQLPAAYQPPARERLQWADAWAGLVTAAVVVLLGAPIGLLWGAVSPRVAVVKASAQAVNLQMPETKAFVAGDGWFLIITLLAGIACGVVGAWLGRKRSPGVAIGLVVGGVLASLIAWKVGHRFGYDSYVQLRDSAKVGSTGSAYLQVRAKGVLLGWAAAASLTLLTITAARRPAAVSGVDGPR